MPEHAYAESPRQLADRWTKEARRGIEGTGIRPGFVKIGVDAGPLSDIDRKLVEAGALCHLATGLTLAIHTGDGAAGLEIVATLSGSGSRRRPTSGSTRRTRGTSRPAPGPRRRARGWSSTAWGRRPSRPTSRAVLDLAARDQLDRVLVSQDAGWYHVGEPGGGAYRPYAFLFDAFVPALRARGLGEAGVRALLVENPARAFAVRRRALATAS